MVLRVLDMLLVVWVTQTKKSRSWNKPEWYQLFRDVMSGKLLLKRGDYRGEETSYRKVRQASAKELSLFCLIDLSDTIFFLFS